MKKNILNLSIIGLSVLSLFFSILSIGSKKKIAFFDYNEVYNNCSLKKRLEKDLLKVAGLRKSELDSMQLELSFLSERIKSNTASIVDKSSFNNLRQRFVTYQQKYEQENLNLKETYFTQIRQEINESVKEYAKIHRYDYLFAAIGDGSLMYGDESEDITNEIQEFID